MEPEKPPQISAPEAPKGEQETQVVEADKTALAFETSSALGTVSAFGQRQSVRNIARALAPEDLTHLGVVKLIIENLDRAEGDCEALQSYVDRFHVADKECAILREKLKTDTAIEVAFAVGVGLGFAIIGLTPSFWDGTFRGATFLGVGILLVAGAVAMRVIKR